MGRQQRVGDLELHFREDLQEREWRLQRISWVVGAVTLAAAIAGFLGPGLFSKTTASPDPGLLVEFQKAERSQRPAEIQVHCRTEAGGLLELRIDRKFIQNVDVTHVEPEPESVSVKETELKYVFASEGDGSKMIIFSFEPRKFGWNRGRISVGEGPSAQVKQFYWP